MIKNVSVKSINVSNDVPHSAVIHNAVNHTCISPVEINISYHNYLPTDITIVERSGLRYLIPSLLKKSHNGRMLAHEDFIVRKEYCFADITECELDVFLNNLDTKSTRGLKGFYDAYTLRINNGAGRHMVKVVVETNLSLKMIRDKGGFTYLNTEDIVISMSGVLDSAPHPFSLDTINENKFDEAMKRSGMGVGCKIEIVDNYEKFGDRYIYVAGELERIRACKDPHRLCGIYVSRLINGYKGDETQEFNVMYYMFEEENCQEKLGMFKTFDDAMCKGDSSEVRRHAILEAENALADKRAALNKEKLEAEEIKFKQDKELMVAKGDIERERMRMEAEAQKHELDLKREKLDMEKENQVLKAKLEAEGIAYKEREMELNKEKDKLERARKEFEYEQEKRKGEFRDQMERRALMRKDSSDVLKFLPMMLIAIGGVFTAFMKIQPKT